MQQLMDSWRQRRTRAITLLVFRLIQASARSLLSHRQPKVGSMPAWNALSVPASLQLVPSHRPAAQGRRDRECGNLQRETKGERHILQGLWGPSSRGEPQKLPSLLQTGKGKAQQGGKAGNEFLTVAAGIFHKQSRSDFCKSLSLSAWKQTGQ